MRVVLIVLALAGASVGSAPAAPLRQSDIAACVAAAATMDTMRACKRIVFKPCVQEPDNRDATYGLVMCNEREGAQWHALLEARTAELKKRDAYRAEALTAADAAWRAWLEVECNFHRAAAMGGSAESVITTECKSDLTAERMILLTWQARGHELY
jgi:uncharacterized protein YecT (DUF1311 family)